jgi:Tol biopolymer transport system component
VRDRLVGAVALAGLVCLLVVPQVGARENGFLAVTTVPGGGPIWRVSPETGASALLTRAFAASNLEWSPDGKALVFNDSASPRLTVRSVDARGNRLPFRLEAAYAPSFAPDGRRIVFQGCGLPVCITTAKADGSDRRQIVRTNPARCRCAVYEPVWSPQGDRIAYVKQQDRTDGGVTYAVRVRTLAGRDRAVPGEDWCSRQGDAAWSPDGRTIAFVCRDGTSPSIAVVSASGGVPRQLAAGRLPTWSPDGRQLAFARDNADQSRTALVVRDVRTGRERIILTRSGVYSIAWQPRPG